MREVKWVNGDFHCLVEAVAISRDNETSQNQVFRSKPTVILGNRFFWMLPFPQTLMSELSFKKFQKKITNLLSLV